MHQKINKALKDSLTGIDGESYEPTMDDRGECKMCDPRLKPADEIQDWDPDERSAWMDE